MKRPYKIVWDFGGARGSEPRTLSFATAERAIEEWEKLPETSQPWAYVYDTVKRKTLRPIR